MVFMWCIQDLIYVIMNKYKKKAIVKILSIYLLEKLNLPYPHKDLTQDYSYFCPKDAPTIMTSAVMMPQGKCKDQQFHRTYRWFISDKDQV